MNPEVGQEWSKVLPAALGTTDEVKDRRPNVPVERRQRHIHSPSEDMKRPKVQHMHASIDNYQLLVLGRNHMKEAFKKQLFQSWKWVK